MNRISKYLVSGVITAAVLGAPLAGAASAGAVTAPHAGLTSASFTVSFGDRYDNGHGTPSQWLLYPLLPTGQGALKSTITITRSGTASPSSCPSSASPCFSYAVTMTASGAGNTIQGAGSPNATLPGNLDCRSFPVTLFNGSGLSETIYSAGSPVHNLQGTVYTGNTPSFSAVPGLAFNAPVNRNITSYRFSYIPSVLFGAAPIGWIDSSTNNDGNSPSWFQDGQITCAFSHQ